MNMWSQEQYFRMIAVGASMILSCMSMSLYKPPQASLAWILCLGAIGIGTWALVVSKGLDRIPPVVAVVVALAALVVLIISFLAHS